MLIICVILVFIAAKRGAIVITFVLLVYFFLQEIKNVKSFSQRVKQLTFIGIVVLSIGYWGYEYLLANDFLRFRLDNVLEGDSSNRDIFYRMIFDYWKDSSNIIYQLFGGGLWNSVGIVGAAAHNDWLEVLSNFGLLGIIVYGIIFFSLYFYARNSLLKNRSCFYAILIVWFMLTLFSMGYTNYSLVCLTILLGFLIGKEERLKLINNKV